MLLLLANVDIENRAKIDRKRGERVFLLEIATISTCSHAVSEVECSELDFDLGMVIL